MVAKSIAKDEAKDVRGVPASQMGARRNSDSKNHARSSISNQMARQVTDEPSSGTKALSEMAHANMETLKSRLPEVDDFLSRASARFNDGTLDGDAYLAEIAPASVVYALIDTLDVLVDAATNSLDKQSLQAASTASGTLAELLRTEGYILSESTYPDNPALEQVRDDMISQRKGSARTLYETTLGDPDVKAALKKLGVGAPAVNLIINPPVRL